MSAYLKYLQIEEVEETAEHPSAYLKIVNIVEVVDQDGNPWEPAPGPDPWDDLVVNQKALLHESNIYEIGETISATTATFTGGSDNVTYRWRWQWRQDPDGAWANTQWNTYDNELTQASYTIGNAGQVRFQCQAKDNDPEHNQQVNDFTSVKSVPYKEFGDVTATVNGIEYDLSGAPGLTVLLNDPIPVVVSITGNASPTYTWDARNDYPLTVSDQAASTTLTLAQEGMASVTCVLTDPNTEEGTHSIIINFFVVDAF